MRAEAEETLRREPKNRRATRIDEQEDKENGEWAEGDEDYTEYNNWHRSSTKLILDG